MNPYVLTATIGILYIVMFGGLTVLRREGLSTQLAIEVLGITAITELVLFAFQAPFSPVWFLILIYLVSMRIRLLVDVANFLSSRGRQGNAIKLLQLSLRLLPDRISRLIVYVNMGIVQIRRKNPASAIELFELVLEESQNGGLSIKYEAACRYNYGVALLRQGNDAQAVREFNEVSIVYPNSIYSRAAEIALAKHRGSKQKPADETPEEI